MMPEKLRGETLLRVVTIIVIVIGAFTIVGGAVSYLSSSLTVSMLGLTASAGEVYKLIGAVTTVSGIVIIVIGIICSKWRKDAENSIAIIILAIVQIVSVIVCGIISTNLNAVIQDQVVNAVVTAMPEMQGVMESELVTSSIPIDPMSLICIVLSILLIIGALLNKSTKPVVTENVRV